MSTLSAKKQYTHSCRYAQMFFLKKKKKKRKTSFHYISIKTLPSCRDLTCECVGLLRDRKINNTGPNGLWLGLYGNNIKGVWVHLTAPCFLQFLQRGTIFVTSYLFLFNLPLPNEVFS